MINDGVGSFRSTAHGRSTCSGRSVTSHRRAGTGWARSAAGESALSVSTRCGRTCGRTAGAYGHRNSVLIRVSHPRAPAKPAGEGNPALDRSRMTPVNRCS